MVNQVQRMINDALAEWEANAKASLTGIVMDYLGAGLPREDLSDFLQPYLAHWMARRAELLERFDEVVQHEAMAEQHDGVACIEHSTTDLRLFP